MKTPLRLFSFSFLFATLLLLAGCDDDEPTPENPEELITTMTLTLTPQGGGSVITWSFVDLDGDGGQAPTITAPALTASTTYVGTIQLLNESETPAEDITVEVAAEALDHQFFFTGTALTSQLVTMAYTDQDSGGNPIGITFSLATTTAGTGELTVTLRHEPDKSAAGVSNGDISNAGGETDIEVTFDVVVQ